MRSTGRMAVVSVLVLSMSALTFLFVGCGKSEPPPAPAPAQTGPTQAQLFAREAVADLAAKNDLNERLWKKDSKASPAAGSDIGTLVFQSPNGLGAVVATQVVGIYDPKNSSWIWAWAMSPNDLRPSLTEFAQRTRQIAQQQNTGELANGLLNPRFNCDPNTVQTLVALANRMNGGQGAIVLPVNDGLLAWVVFKDIKLMKAEQLPSTQPSSTQPTTGPTLGSLTLEPTSQPGLMLPSPTFSSGSPTTMPMPTLPQVQPPPATAPFR